MYPFLVDLAYATGLSSENLHLFIKVSDAVLLKQSIVDQLSNDLQEDIRVQNDMLM